MTPVNLIGAVFISMAVVIADQAVVEKLGAATIDELRDAFTSKLRSAPLVEATALPVVCEGMGSS